MFARKSGTVFLDPHFKEVILTATGADDLTQLEVIQELWSGYGHIVRYALTGSELDRVVVKHVRLPERNRHPRGWNTDLSHERKLTSYQVETAWYAKWSGHCDDLCRVPRCLALESKNDEVLMVLEDLDAVGFPSRLSWVGNAEMKACLTWLAHFHACFMGKQPDQLWTVGTYWHLATRPDELEELDDMRLKRAAAFIDERLNSAKYRSFVHGDAKLANFCFSQDGASVAAVDFQYIGGGCGMKDVAYFLGSCLDEEQCESREAELLDYYFSELRRALTERGCALDPAAIESEWRELYPVAWTDFFRFLQGWSPGHWKIHGYSERLAREVMDELGV